jgi:hypothetical protein
VVLPGKLWDLEPDVYGGPVLREVRRRKKETTVFTRLSILKTQNSRHNLVQKETLLGKARKGQL